MGTPGYYTFVVPKIFECWIMILYQFSNIFRDVGSIWGHFGAIQGHQGQFQKAGVKVSSK